MDGSGPVIVGQPLDSEIVVQPLAALTYVMAPKVERIAVKVKRGRAVTEEIVLSVSGLPEGVTARGTIPAGSLDGVLEIESTAAAKQGEIAVSVTADVPKSPLTPKPRSMANTKLFVRGLPGTLDLTFGDQGYAFPTLAVGQEAFGVDLVVAPDGSITVLAECDPNGSRSACLARLDNTGKPDPTFAGGGLQTYGWSTPYSLFRQPDGKLLLGGGLPLVIARVEANGAADAAFGNGNAGPGTFRGAGGDSGVLLLGANATHVAGLFDGHVGVEAQKRVYAFKLSLADGSYDGTFGTRNTTFNNSDSYTSAGLAMRADGRVLLVGNTSDHIAFTQLNADGSLDTTFGTGGYATYGAQLMGWNKYSPGVVLQPDGSVVVVVHKIDRGLGLLKLAPGGTVVNGFGLQFSDFYFGFPFGLIPEPGGTFLVPFDSTGLKVARFDKLGALDKTFGTNGFAVANRPPGSRQGRVAIAPDGRILTTGKGYSAANEQHVFVARLWH